jgi:hypothetical protein
LQYNLVEFPASIIFLYLPPPILRIVNRSHFSISYMSYDISTVFSLLHCTISLFSYLSLALSLSLYQPPERICLTFLSSIFEKRHFCLFRVSLQEVSLWHFHVYMYYIRIGHALHFSPFYLSPILMAISTGLKIL